MSGREGAGPEAAYGNSPYLHKYRGESRGSNETQGSGNSRRTFASTGTAKSLGTTLKSVSIAADSPSIILHKTSSPRRSLCFLLTAGVLIAAACLLVTALLLFFTVGGNAVPTFGAGRPRAEALRRRLQSPPLSVHSELVSAQLVHTRLSSGKGGASPLCLLDALFGGSAQAFVDDRLPGAQHFDINRATEDGRPHQRFQLLHPIKFQSYARSLGLSGRCHVVVYARDSSERAQSAAAYVWWLFKLYGHPQVSLLKETLDGWKELGYETESGPVREPERGDFRAMWSSRWLATAADVRKGDWQLLDARSESMFLGKSRHVLAKARGSIDGSRHLPSTLFPLSVPRTQADVIQILGARRLDATKPSVVYGNSGLGGAKLLFALAQARLPARLYNGGWIEWSQSIYT